MHTHLPGSWPLPSGAVKLICFAAEVPKLSSRVVPASTNKLPVAGQHAHKAAGPAPQETPTPLHTSQNKRTPLQVYETDKPFFGSAPVGGLDILCSESPACKPVILRDSISDDNDNANHNNADNDVGLANTCNSGNDNTICDDTEGK